MGTLREAMERDRLRLARGLNRGAAVVLGGAGIAATLGGAYLADKAIRKIEKRRGKTKKAMAVHGNLLRKETRKAALKGAAILVGTGGGLYVAHSYLKDAKGKTKKATEKVAGVSAEKMDAARRILTQLPGARPGGNKERYGYLWKRLEAKRLGRASNSLTPAGSEARTVARERLSNVPTIAKGSHMPSPRSIKDALQKTAGLRAFVDELEKIAWDWKGFKEGIVDEGIPLGGATIGATLGHAKPLRGAALGYAAGGALSLMRGKGKKKTAEEPSDARRVLGASAMGYGAGAGAHLGLSRIAKFRPHLHAKGWKGALLEEGLPAIGATLATGVAMATRKKKQTIG